MESAEIVDIWDEISCDLPSEVQKKLTEMAVFSSEEVCGFITEDFQIVEIDNVSSDPMHGFVMNQHQMMEALGVHKILATFHSHPGGRPWPSATDSENMTFLYQQGCPWRYLIAVTAGVYEFRHRDRS